MNATATVPSTRHARPATHPAPVPFGRLTLVELRKQLDTRAGVWLLTVIVLLSAGLIALVLVTGEPADRTWQQLTAASSLAQLLLLPLLGIMAATGEWSQRTALTTFTLEPRRGRVVLAKALGALVLGVVLVAVAFGAAAVATAADGGTWDLDAAAGGGLVLALLIYVLQGVAFGLLFLNTPVAIVLVLVLPTAWTILTQVFSSLTDVGAWLDLDAVTAPLFEGDMAARDWAQLGTATGVWVLLPLAIGTYRVLTREVK